MTTPIDRNIVSDMIGSLKQYGYNCDRSNVTTMVALVLEREKEYKRRLETIGDISNLSLTV